MSEFNLTRIGRIRYRPTSLAENFLGFLRTTLIPGDKATVARLAIARSLAEISKSNDINIPNDAEMGYAIEGNTLFGDDADLWASLIVASIDNPPQDAVSFKSLVEAHWHRGAQLLKCDFDECNQSEIDFVIKLARMVPQKLGASTAFHAEQHEGPVEMHFGAISKDFNTNEEISCEINAPGVSPHIALLGKTRSGKTRTGLEITAEIAIQTDAPIVLIDPKGEFVRDGILVSKAEWNGNTIEQFFPGIKPIDIPYSPLPLDVLARPYNAMSSELPQLAISFRDSFLKCIRARGDIAADLLRQSVLNLLERQREPITLADIRDTFALLSDEEGRSVGSIGAKLSEMVSLNLIVPEAPPETFFTKRWVIGLGEASPEPKRLIMFLLLDALKTFLLYQPDSQVDFNGYRSIRQLLVIDEAKEILAYKHGALSALIRRGASKGGVIALFSQSPDDFEQEDDDFLENMGIIGVYASSSQRVRRLSAGFGRKLRSEEFSDRALPRGVALVKLPGMEPKKVLGWQ